MNNEIKISGLDKHEKQKQGSLARPLSSRFIQGGLA